MIGLEQAAAKYPTNSERGSDRGETWVGEEFLAPFVLILVFSIQRVLAAELSPINFVSSGSAGIVEVIKFSEKQGFFKKQGLDVTMIYVPSGVLAAQTVVSGSALIANNSVSDILNAIAAGAP